MKISPNAADECNDENSFPYKLLLINTQALRLCKAFVNNFSDNIKLSKTHLYNIGWSARFLRRLLGPFIKNRLPLAKSISIRLGLIEAASATDAAIHKKMFKLENLSDLTSCMTTLIISNEEMNDIIKTVKVTWRIWLVDNSR